MLVLITGATSGFGEAMARRYVREGHAVIITGRRGGRLQRLASELGPKALPRVFDIRDRAETERFLATLPEGWRDIDVLVNNAGLALGLEPAHRAALADWEQMVDTNIKGLMTITRQVLPGMVARNRGHIVNIGSMLLTRTAVPSRSGPAWPAAPSSPTCASMAMTPRRPRSMPTCSR